MAPSSGLAAALGLGTQQQQQAASKATQHRDKAPASSGGASSSGSINTAMPPSSSDTVIRGPAPSSNRMFATYLTFPSAPNTANTPTYSSENDGGDRSRSNDAPEGGSGGGWGAAAPPSLLQLQLQSEAAPHKPALGFADDDDDEQGPKALPFQGFLQLRSQVRRGRSPLPAVLGGRVTL